MSSEGTKWKTVDVITSKIKQATILFWFEMNKLIVLNGWLNTGDHPHAF